MFAMNTICIRLCYRNHKYFHKNIERLTIYYENAELPF